MRKFIGYTADRINALMVHYDIPGECPDQPVTALPSEKREAVSHHDYLDMIDVKAGVSTRAWQRRNVGDRLALHEKWLERPDFFFWLGAEGHFEKNQRVILESMMSRD